MIKSYFMQIVYYTYSLLRVCLFMLIHIEKIGFPTNSLNVKNLLNFSVWCRINFNLLLNIRRGRVMKALLWTMVIQFSAIVLLKCEIRWWACGMVMRCEPQRVGW